MIVFGSIMWYVKMYEKGKFWRFGDGMEFVKGG